MTNYASKISGVASLVLAALPIAALATAAHAQTVVKVSDINLLSPQGVSEYNQRADAAGRAFCLSERTVAGHAACLKGGKIDLTEKLTGQRTAQLDRASPT